MSDYAKKGFSLRKSRVFLKKTFHIILHTLNGKIEKGDKKMYVRLCEKLENISSYRTLKCFASFYTVSRPYLGTQTPTYFSNASGSDFLKHRPSLLPSLSDSRL